MFRSCNFQFPPNQPIQRARNMELHDFAAAAIPRIFFRKSAVTELRQNQSPRKAQAVPARRECRIRSPGSDLPPKTAVCEKEQISCRDRGMTTSLPEKAPPEPLNLVLRGERSQSRKHKFAKNRQRARDRRAIQCAGPAVDSRKEQPCVAAKMARGPSTGKRRINESATT